MDDPFMQTRDRRVRAERYRKMGCEYFELAKSATSPISTSVVSARRRGVPNTGGGGIEAHRPGRCPQPRRGVTAGNARATHVDAAIVSALQLGQLACGALFD